MSLSAEQRRYERAAGLTDKELYRALYLYDQVGAINLELRDMMTLIWPGDLLADMSSSDIQALLQAELNRRTVAKGQGVV